MPSLFIYLVPPGSQEDQLVEVRECEQTEDDGFLANVVSATGNPEVYNDDLTLTDVIILSDLNSDGNTTSSPEDSSSATEETWVTSPGTSEADGVSTPGAPTSSEVVEEHSPAESQDDQSTISVEPAVTERPVEATTRATVNVKLSQKGKPSEKKENTKKTKPTTLKKNLTKTVSKSSEKADNSLLNKEIIFVVREDSSNFTSSVPKKGRKPLSDKGEIVIQDPNQTVTEEKVNVTHSPVEGKKVNRVTGQGGEPALLDDAVTGTSLPAAGVQDSATVAKATGDRVLVLDKNALWGMLREGSKTSEDLKKGG